MKDSIKARASLLEERHEYAELCYKRQCRYRQHQQRINGSLSDHCS